jgi:HEAT repeat protein
MQPLELLWLLSLALSFLSIATMCILVIRRTYENRINANMAKWHDRLVPVVLEAIAQSGPPPRLEQIRGRRSRHLLGRIGQEFLNLVKGEERTRMIALLEANGVVEICLYELKHAAPSRRIELLSMLAFFNHEETRTALLSTLKNDPDQSVRVSAAVGLLRLCSLPPIEKAIADLRISPANASRRLSAFFRAYALQHPDDALRFVRHAQAPLLITLMLNGLSLAGNHDALPLLIDLTEHADMDVRAEAFRSLSRLGHPVARESVSRGLKDEAWPVRAQAAMCAGRIGLVEVTEEVAALLDDPAWWARYRAADALLKLGERGRNLLIAASTGKTRAGRIAQLILQEKPAA